MSTWHVDISWVDVNWGEIYNNKDMKGQIFHVLNRGVDKRKIFFGKEDYLRFMSGLIRFNNKSSALRFSGDANSFITNPPKQDKIVEILKWTLMPNHYHLLLQERIDGGVVEFMKRLGNGYTKYINFKNKRSGYLFQNAARIIQVFKDEDCLYLPFYIEANPINLIEPYWKECGLIKDSKKARAFLEDYVWSSYSDYIGSPRFPAIVNKDLFYKLFDTDREHYKKYFLQLLKHGIERYL